MATNEKIRWVSEYYISNEPEKQNKKMCTKKKWLLQKRPIFQLDYQSNYRSFRTNAYNAQNNAYFLLLIVCPAKQ